MGGIISWGSTTSWPISAEMIVPRKIFWRKQKENERSSESLKMIEKGKLKTSFCHRTACHWTRNAVPLQLRRNKIIGERKVSRSKSKPT